MIAAEVRLWGTRIGVVSQEVQEIPRFQYAPEFIKSEIQLAPLMMPLNEQVYSFPELTGQTFCNLPGLLADSLPDRFGSELWEKYLRMMGKNAEDISAVEKLLYMGKRGMGALEYYPEAEGNTSALSIIKINELCELADELMNNQNEQYSAGDNPQLEQLVSVGVSPGGARPKAVVAWNQVTNEFRSGQASVPEGFEQYIIKFDSGAGEGTRRPVPFYTQIEYAYYLMAVAAGIEMSFSALYREDERVHFLTRRFDRAGNNKLHLQSLGAIAHWDYRNSGVYSYEEAAAILQKIGLQQPELEKLYKRMVFNVLAQNCDDHVKNFALLMNREGEWSLAPAYDLTFVYSRNGHELTVQGKRKSISREELYSAAGYMNISRSIAKAAIEEVSAALEKWPLFAEEAEIRKKEREFIGRRIMP